VIEIEDSTAELQHVLEVTADHAGDLTGAWDDIGRWWQARQKTVFATRNRGAWPMRSSATKAMSRGLMMRTGTLLRVVSSPRPLYSSPTTARFGHPGYGAAYYGRFHQFGQSQPLREVVPGLTATEGEEVAQIIADYVMEGA
jgi:hypothetical protein